ncbi:MAG: PmbA/TldA family metallopeptidase [bacterium]
MKAFLKRIISNLAVDYADIRIEQSEGTRVIFRGRELDDAGRGFEKGGCLRLFHRGNWLVATFNIVDEGLKELADELAAQAAMLPAREGGVVLLPAFDEEVRLPKEYHPHGVPLEQKKELIQHYNNLLIKNTLVGSTVSDYQDRHRVVCF